MSGPYRAAMMLRLRCHEGLWGVGDADSYRRGGFHRDLPSQHRRQRLGGVLSGAEGLVQCIRVAADLY